MGSKWRKIKVALGLNQRVYGTRNHLANNNDCENSLPPLERRSDAALLSPPGDWTSTPPTPASNKPKLSKSLSRSSSKNICSICLASMRQGDGQAIFTAECSHSFHFHCIASNVKHGNQICPVCREKWKEIPAKRPTLVLPPGRERINPLELPQNNEVITLMPRLPPRLNSSRNTAAPILHSPEPAMYNDDESLDRQIGSAETSTLNRSSSDYDGQRKVIIKTYTEVSAVLRSRALDSFTVLLHVKAPSNLQNPSKNDAKLPALTQTPRAPVDIVTVLDISGSMAGTKLALLKRAMGFVIQILGPNDRLAVIAFSSTARRLFSLRRMSENGRQHALQAVNSLVASGGTNIAEGLRKGAKIMEDRREKNPVASIIILSDGQDTYTINNVGGTQRKSNYEQLLPLSVRREVTSSFKIPVHAFGFGADHDASSMHSISEISGGTFSFIETESVIQDAFAQCLGGLLSVVVKDLELRVESVDPGIRLGGLKSGSYPNQISSDQRRGFINIGDLYADEERDFLVSLNAPAEKKSRNNTSLLAVKCVYNDPLTKESVTVECEEVRIDRSERAGLETVSIEVDRQKNRINAAEAMAQARTAAENGDLAGAVSILESCRKTLSETLSAKSDDNLCVALDSELKEMQDRMASRRMYDESGRAYLLSGLSSHSWQRATARGDSTGSLSLLQAYQTPSMVEMVTRSQATLSGGPLVRPKQR